MTRIYTENPRCRLDFKQELMGGISTLWEINNRLNDITETLGCYIFRFMLPLTWKEFLGSHVVKPHCDKVIFRWTTKTSLCIKYSQL